MKRLNFIILLLSSILFFSCEKDPDEITVTINQQGNLKIKVIDNDKKPVSDANVYVSYSTDYNLYEGVSDKSGMCDVGKLLQGSYLCYATAEKNGVPYSVSEIVQIIAGSEKVLEMNPLANAGALTLYFYSYYNINVGALNVALLPFSLGSQPSVDQIKSAAYFTGKTDKDGVVKFTEIPAERRYNVYAYTDEGLVYRVYDYSYVYAYKNTEQKYTLEVY
ncbi:hypothetical protein [Dysgonomonas sp. 520]|uniref:hypothetical protein n=1 Tax=Dysgonomonas sp. 520 TaxID=2302931 RepID=UPI0013D42DF8|nr:hypothetical protein [Dysgonomonas sp. 520]NDW08146.1 hypothetical protein [Dysgonomonas sp. 520]